MLYTSEDILKATGGRLIGSAFTVNSLSMDSRAMEKGDFFIPIKGEKFDGHAYMSEVEAKGAVGAFIEEGRPLDGFTMPLIVVKDVYQALVDLARFNRKRFQGKVIGVTGSAGKTSSREMLYLLLSQLGPTHRSIKSYNNWLGVPYMLATCPPEAHFAVYEIGMNQAGEITPLSEMVKPHVAFITNILPVHLGNLGSLDNIAKAKAEIFAGLQLNGVAIVNGDSAFTDLILDATRPGTKTFVFGSTPQFDASLLSYKTVDGFEYVQAQIQGEPLFYKIGTPGGHFALNSVGCLMVLKALGVDPAPIMPRLKAFTGLTGRGEIVPLNIRGNGITLVDESYNANPSSIKAALKRMSLLKTKGRRIFVMGHMTEIGETTRDAHLSLLDSMRDAGVNLFFACGRDAKPLFDAVDPKQQGIWSPTSDGLIDMVLSSLKDQDVIMIKGAFSTKMAVIVDALKQKGRPHAV